MAGVDINTPTMKQYLVLEETFSGNKNEDAHDNVDRVLNIISLFNIPKVTQDAVLLRVFPFTLTVTAKRWVDRLTPGTVNTWDLLKKTFIQRYCPPSKTAKRLEDIHKFKQESNESLYQAWERFNDLMYKCPTHDINSHQKDLTLTKNALSMRKSRRWKRSTMASLDTSLLSTEVMEPESTTPKENDPGSFILPCSIKSIAGGLDHVNHVIRLPLKHGIIKAGEEEHQSPSLNKDQPKPSHSPATQELDSDSSSPDLKNFDNTLPLTLRQLIKYLKKTDKLVQATMDSLDKIATDRVNLLKAFNGVNKTLKAIQYAVKEDEQKILEAIESFTKISSDLTELLSFGENDSKEPPSHTEGEHITMEDDKAKEEPTREVTLIESSSKPPLTDPILEIFVPRGEVRIMLKPSKSVKTGQYQTRDWKSTPKARSKRIFLQQSSNEAKMSKDWKFKDHSCHLSKAKIKGKGKMKVQRPLLRHIQNIVEPEFQAIENIVPMADRTMEELFQSPTDGYEEAIVIPEILAENFEIKTNLLQDVSNDAIKLMLFPYSLEDRARI
nr:hypothetical protein [Tanacetum cinerariifolium]